VFSREDGSPLRHGFISEHFRMLIRQAGLPPVRFHDLRHGAATMLKMSGVAPAASFGRICEHG
jgi:integrase